MRESMAKTEAQVQQLDWDVSSPEEGSDEDGREDVSGREERVCCTKCWQLGLILLRLKCSYKVDTPNSSTASSSIGTWSSGLTVRVPSFTCRR